MDNLGFVELNTQELEEVNGGIPAFLVGFLIGALIAALIFDY
ncbi:hypothetical protein SDC9_194734 [bioreactor metagenome]|uniref:Class IIb bacteriocin, lactobin A/cerein 7B family n=1 Tax=bioreactor metagenome TaxID=1076179 RepID=A0A645IFR0_9ZZZZ